MGNNFSDNNDARSLQVSQRRLYADLPLPFTIHPNTQDLTAFRDIDAVKQSVKNLVLTNYGERPFRPNIGCNATGYLFENADIFTIVSLQDEIYDVLANFEPRVRNVTVEVLDNSDANAYQVNIQFNVVFSDQRQETNFYLERTR